MPDAQSVSLFTTFEAASSSFSFSALAAARSLVAKGALYDAALTKVDIGTLLREEDAAFAFLLNTPGVCH